MRDAQSLLDQIISFSSLKGGDRGEYEIAEEDSLAILGIVSLDSHIRQMECILAGDAVGAMDEVEKLSSQGVDIARYVAGLIDAIRIIRLMKRGARVADMLGFSPDEKKALERLAGSFDDEELSALFGLGSALQAELRTTSSERISLEMALLDMISLHGRPSIAAIIKKLESGGEKKNESPESTPSLKVKSGNEVSEKQARPFERPGPEDFKKIWSRFLRYLQNEQQYLFSIVKSATVAFTDNVLSISFPDEEGAIYYRMLDSSRQKFIKEKLAPHLGDDLRLVLEREETVRQGAPPSPVPADSDGALKRISNAPDGDSGMPLPEAEMIAADVHGDDDRNPAIDKIRDAFSGEIIDKGENDA
jgi:DNA polymerase-3 subunit gamma/tau